MDFKTIIAGIVAIIMAGAALLFGIFATKKNTVPDTGSGSGDTGSGSGSTGGSSTPVTPVTPATPITPVTPVTPVPGGDGAVTYDNIVGWDNEGGNIRIRFKAWDYAVTGNTGSLLLNQLTASQLLVAQQWLKDHGVTSTPAGGSTTPAAPVVGDYKAPGNGGKKGLIILLRDGANIGSFTNDGHAGVYINGDYAAIDFSEFNGMVRARGGIGSKHVYIIGDQESDTARYDPTSGDINCTGNDAQVWYNKARAGNEGFGGKITYQLAPATTTPAPTPAPTSTDWRKQYDAMSCDQLKNELSRLAPSMARIPPDLDAVTRSAYAASLITQKCKTTSTPAPSTPKPSSPSPAPSQSALDRCKASCGTGTDIGTNACKKGCEKL